MRQSAVDLLEQEEAKKIRQQAAERAQNNEPEPVEASHDSRRLPRDRREDRIRGRDSNANRYSLEREENDERRSRRSRDLADDDEMRDASDKGSANGSVRSRRVSSPEPVERPRRSSRDRYQDYDRRNRGGDYYDPGRRGPVRARDDYRPSRGGRDRPRERSRERSPPRYQGRDRGGRDAGYRQRSPPRRAQTPEPTDDERDRRTVFVQQLAARLRGKELRKFFEQAGTVVDAQIVTDRVSQRSKGYLSPFALLLSTS